MKKVDTDEREARLKAQVLKPFAGEAPCDPQAATKLLDGAPMLPMFGPADEVTQRSMKAVKRWISTNLREWPTCRHSRQPLELRFESRPLPGDEYGGSYCKPYFYCDEC